jgi:hypothetical protein
MPDRTVNEITDDAYGLTGNTSPTAAEDTKALRFFQNMLSSWSAQGLLVPYYVTENFTLTIGQAVYTIGVSGNSPDLVTATSRPIKPVRAWIRQSDNDHPIDVRMSEREYGEIARKDTTQRPTRLYYDPQYPNGTIRFNYESDQAHDFHLVSEKPLTDVTAKTDILNLPLEVNEALVFNLAPRLSGGIKSKISDDVRRIAVESKAVLEKINTRFQINPTKLDNALL